MEQKYEISTNKLTIKTRNLVEHEVDVELPYFAKYGNAYYKVISNTQSITVGIWEWSNISIEFCQHNPFVHPEAVACTEEEFNIAFETALSKISNL